MIHTVSFKAHDRGAGFRICEADKKRPAEADLKYLRQTIKITTSCRISCGSFLRPSFPERWRQSRQQQSG